MSSRQKPCIGITFGDPAGIGPEIIAKSLNHPAIRKRADYILIGHKDIYSRYTKRNYKNITIVEPGIYKSRGIRPGTSNRQGACASLHYLEEAVELLKEKKISRLVTAPVCKEQINKLGRQFHGHTEYLASAFKTQKFDMMFVSSQMRTLIVTRHIPVNQVSRNLSQNNIYRSIALTHQYLKRLFKIKDPRIAVCGLNPHAGEGGDIGDEEKRKIRPAIKKAQSQRMRVFGPFPADTLFTKENRCGYDTIIAMYHDQGLIPIKSLYFNELVNLTIGLPFIRTSPCHGTAFNIAGKNKANPSSMMCAIKLASELTV